MLRVIMKATQLAEIMNFVKAPVRNPDRKIWTNLLVKGNEASDTFIVMGSDGTRAHRIYIHCKVEYSDGERKMMPWIKPTIKGGSVTIDFTEDQVVLNYSAGHTEVYKNRDSAEGYPHIEEVFDMGSGEVTHRHVDAKLLKEAAMAFKSGPIKFTVAVGDDLNLKPYKFKDESGDRQIVLLPMRCDW